MAPMGCVLVGEDEKAASQRRHTLLGHAEVCGGGRQPAIDRNIRH